MRAGVVVVMLVVAGPASGATPFAFPSAARNPYAAAEPVVDADGSTWFVTGGSSVTVSIRRGDGTVVTPRDVPIDPSVAPAVATVAVRDGVTTIAWSEWSQLPGEQRKRAMRCRPDGCGPVQTLARGGSRDAPFPLTDERGRSLVMWRGATRKGWRLCWAITTAGRFGRVHTLGVIGSAVALIARPGGGETAAWVSGGRGARPNSLQTADRVRGEFGDVHDVAAPDARTLRLVRAGDDTILAWQTLSVASGDLESGPVWASIRAQGVTRFPAGSRVSGGNAQQVALAGSPSGRAVLTFVEPGADGLPRDLVAVAREPGDRFGTPQSLDRTDYGADSGASGSAIAIGPADAAVAVWTHFDAERRSEVRMAAAPARTAFGPSAVIGFGDRAFVAGGSSIVALWHGDTGWAGVANP